MGRAHERVAHVSDRRRGLQKAGPRKRRCVERSGMTGIAGGIVGRADLERRDVGGRPRDAPSLGHEPRGEGERVRDQEVRTPVHGRQGVLVGLPARPAGSAREGFGSCPSGSP